MEIEKDRIFSLAESYVMETGVSVFLTGKAGTGKTTFLRSIVERTDKRCVVVAPTGVAAMNAGGVTIHSFFQLPLCPYLPDVPELVTEYQMHPRNFRMRKDRMRIIRTLDLLIIDEVSMVRADLMDAMDMVLRRCRHSEQPFGGVQLLMIGDVQQLPPVVTEAERPYIEKVYPSPYFFYSKALSRLEHVVIELGKVHRQEDRHFIDLLNDVRGGNPSARTVNALNSRLDPDFDPPENEGWIRLTTHNSQADSVNMAKLAVLKGPEQLYSAQTEGEFPVSAYPVDPELRLKVGAQVMFVRNDTRGEGQYYNGKLARVSQLEPELVVTDESGESVIVPVEEWENISYALDPEDNEIKAKVEGVFRQYPLRLAWAVTIHKSQGLSFDHVVIDAAAAFSSGQVYVALSRCRSLEGIVLTSPITRRCTFTDPLVNAFEAGYTALSEVEAAFDSHRENYRLRLMCEAFDLEYLRICASKLNRIWQLELASRHQEESMAFASAYGRKGGQEGLWYLQETAEKFRRQLRSVFLKKDEALLAERINKAAVFFSGALTAMVDMLLTTMIVEPTAKDTAKSFREHGLEFLKEFRMRLGLMLFIRSNGFINEAFLKARIARELSPENRLRPVLRSIGALVSKELAAEEDPAREVRPSRRRTRKKKT